MSEHGSEMPEALRGLNYDRFMQRGARVITSDRDNRDTHPDLRRWPVEGMEFADSEIARTADFRRYTFGLHSFETWDEGVAWLRVDGRHERWHDCPDCSEARAVYERVWAESEAEAV